MTTIACDRKSMAADSESRMSGGLRVNGGEKIRCINNHLVGVSGNLDSAFLFFTWFEDQEKHKDMKFDDDFTALILTPKGNIYDCYRKLVLTPVLEPYWAIGSGQEYALGAMYNGADVVQAVKTAIHFDMWSGGEVTRLFLKNA